MCWSQICSLWACKDKGQGSDPIGSVEICVCQFLCGNIFLHYEDVTMLSAGEGILSVLWSYNGSTERGKNGDLMKIGVKTPEGTNSRRAEKMVGVNVS